MFNSRLNDASDSDIVNNTDLFADDNQMVNNIMQVMGSRRSRQPATGSANKKKGIVL